MHRVMVRYRVKPEHVEHNEALVRAVYDELERTRPAGLRYATFKLADGVSFAHLASIETPDGRSPLPALTAFGAFQAGIAERCDEPPEVIALDTVGTFRVLSGP